MNRQTVSVVIPALNEEATIGDVIASLQPLRSGSSALIDEVIVVDPDSTDTTAQVAAAAGATVVNWRSVLPTIPPRPGKGEALWRGVAATTSDIICFMDADLLSPEPDWVAKLVQPLLDNPALQLVRGSYDRVLNSGGTLSFDGGRVTELTMRPLLAALRPELASISQPLGGEYSARRQALRQLPFAPGYGVETGILLDIADRYGVQAIAEAALGQRRHRNRPLAELGPMARQVVATLLDRCGIADSGASLVTGGAAGQAHGNPAFTPTVENRPPLTSL